MPDFASILGQFRVWGEFQEAHPYGGGHINDTYLAHFRGRGGQVNRYILQRINHNVFTEPVAVMENIIRVTEHIRKKIRAEGGDPTRKTIQLIPTLNGDPCYLSPSGNFWRLCHFIAGAQTYQSAVNPRHFYQVAYAFGEFFTLLSDLLPGHINATIPDFHHTPKRYQAFIQAAEEDSENRAHNVKPEIDFIIARESEIRIVVDLLETGDLPERVTHNDTKIDNVMLDDKTGEGICVIDLDTVMPGVSLFDFGDAVRSGANLSAEDEPDLRKVAFSLDIFDRLANGFLDAARGVLTSVEVDHLAFGAKLITLEQGIRFLTDYLNGDTYYKTQHPLQNLHRARTQLKLVSDMKANAVEMEACIDKYR